MPMYNIFSVISPSRHFEGSAKLRVLGSLLEARCGGGSWVLPDEYEVDNDVDEARDRRKATLVLGTWP